MAKKNVMSRAALAATLFETRPQVGGRQLHPLTGGRLVILDDRKNPLVKGAREGEEVNAWGVYEVLMVAELDDEALVEVSLEDDDGWAREVRRYALGVSDAELTEFWALMEAEMDAIRKARAVPKKKAVSKGRSGARNRTGG